MVMNMEKKCENVLMKCKARCCKYLAQTLPKDADEDLLIYYKNHNAIIKKQNNCYLVLVPVKCKYLDRFNRCLAYENKPNICTEAYEKNKINCVFFPHCIYEPGLCSFVLEEKDFGDNR